MAGLVERPTPTAPQTKVRQSLGDGSSYNAFTPQYAFDPSFFDDAQNTFRQAATQATTGVDTAYNHAASQLRSRLEAARQGNNRQIIDKYSGRGIAPSGMANRELRLNDQNSNSELAGGLTQLGDDYQKRMLDVANSLTGIGQGQSAAGLGYAQGANSFNQLMSNDQIENRKLDVDQGLGRQKALTDFFNSFAQYGKAGNTTAQFNTDFQGLLDQIFSLFGGQGKATIPGV